MLLNTDAHGNISYTYESNELDSQRILDYWTDERKALAIPIGIDLTDPYPYVPDVTTQATEPQHADITQMPFMTGGKLFFSNNNINYVASAALACQRNILLTAAHCVQDRYTGQLCDNFLFERCFDNGRSAEKLTFKTVALKVYWHEQKQFKWDYAFAILNETSSLTTPLTYSIQEASGMTLTDFGYPTNVFSGKQMSFVDGLCHTRYDGTLIIDGDLMSSGASGGAWVIKGTSTLVGIHSFGPASGVHSYSGSPILDSEFDNLYQYVATLL